MIFNTQINMNYLVVEGNKGDTSLTFVVRDREGILSIRYRLKGKEPKLDFLYEFTKNILRIIQYEVIGYIEVSLSVGIYMLSKDYIDKLISILKDQGFIETSMNSMSISGCKVTTHTYTAILTNLCVVKAVLTIEELGNRTNVGIVFSKRLVKLEDIPSVVTELLNISSPIFQTSKYI